jgi:hypothetical protein
MLLKAWDALPARMRNAPVRGYYELLRQKRAALVLKRLFDVLASIIILLAILLPLLLALMALIKHRFGRAGHVSTDEGDAVWSAVSYLQVQNDGAPCRKPGDAGDHAR